MWGHSFSYPIYVVAVASHREVVNKHPELIILPDLGDLVTISYPFIFYFRLHKRTSDTHQLILSEI